MSQLVPSYILKAGRAEKHLHDLKLAIQAWTDTHPYEVVTRTEGKREVHQLRFTSNPPPEIGMIAADFVYNLRSGLDHLMAALVPAAVRSKVYFPIYWAGVWEAPIPGENKERTKARCRWQSDTDKVKPEALAILKALQPAEGARDDNDPAINAFLMLNRLSNKDRHQQLPLVYSGLVGGVNLLWKDANGKDQIARGIMDNFDIAENGAELQYPPDAVDVQVAGAPVIAVALPSPKGNVKLPDAFDMALAAYRTRAVGPLAPYIHVR